MTIEEIEAALKWVDDGCPIPIPEFFRYPGVNFSHEAVRVLFARIKELETENEKLEREFHEDWRYRYKS